MVTIDLQNYLKIVTKIVPLVLLRDQVGPQTSFWGYESQVKKTDPNKLHERYIVVENDPKRTPKRARKVIVFWKARPC